jgi:hypothetical protein
LTGATGGFVNGTGGATIGTGGGFGQGGSVGTGSAPSTGGIVTGTGGSGNGGSGTGGAQGGSGGTGTFPPPGPYTNPGFKNLAPPMLEPLTKENATTLSPPALAGWDWYAIDGALCRDGSQAGLFTRVTDSDKLVVYIEGGGACSDKGFCNFNPPNVNKVISGDGQIVLGSALGLADVRQQPGAFAGGVLQGMFDETNATNPFKGWNMVYIPYCTGDVHFGTKRDGTVGGLPDVKQQFVGHLNMQKFVGHVVPTFKSKLKRGVIMGVSAGSFGAALNFSMWQDAFDTVHLDGILDSGPPFKDQFMPVCMQKRWREMWGFANSLPPDCTECQQADGGGLVGLADFLIRKHPNAHLAMISSTEDEVIRLFFSGGVKDCVNFDTVDPVELTVGQILDPTLIFDAKTYTAGLMDLRATFTKTNRFSTYFIGGPPPVQTYHQHSWRPRFYEKAAGNETIAEFIQGFLDGKIEQVGPEQGSATPAPTTP